MPKGVYPRSQEYLALLADRMSERRKSGTLVSPTAHLHTPEMKAQAVAANRIARPPKRYARVGTGSACQWIHRVRAEKALGKPLPTSAHVHHADGSKNPNAPLVICPDNAYHAGLHRRMRVQAAGGNPWTDKICAACKTVKPKTEFYSDISSPEGLSTKCKDCVRRLRPENRRKSQVA
jgi:hypothetical protein